MDFTPSSSSFLLVVVILLDLVVFARSAGSDTAISYLTAAPYFPDFAFHRYKRYTMGTNKAPAGGINWVLVLTVVVAVVGVILAVVPQERLVDHLDDVLTYLQETKEHLRTHPNLHGNFRPVTGQEHRAVACEVVEGEIPADLEGLFVRNGPNPLPGWTKRYHWFDGHGMLHNLRFLGGQATYTNQYTGTPRYKVEAQLGKDYFFRIGELSGFVGVFKAIFVAPFKLKFWGMDALTQGQANTDTVMYNGKFYLLHEGSLPFEAKLHPDGTFESIGYSTFGGVLDYPVSAHPKVDYQTNSMVFHSYAADPGLMERDGAIKYVSCRHDRLLKPPESMRCSTHPLFFYFSRYGELLANGTVRIYRGLAMNHTSFVHDMMITPHYMIFADSSVHFDISRVLAGKSVFSWKEHQNMRIALVSRETGELVRWFDAGKPHGIVHPINAWEEEDGTVVMWAPVGDHMDLELESHTNWFHMSEIRMNPQTGDMTMERLDTEYNEEFSNVRTDYYGRFSAYGVAGTMDVKKADGVFNGFIIWDIEDKSIYKKVQYPSDEWGGEPVVIEKPGVDDSRAFYIGTFIHKETTDDTFFVLYEQDELVARIKIPHRVPFGLHGNWIPENLLQEHFQTHSTVTNS